ncbi:tyrosine recombinase XerC [Actinomadura syzygii]|uniref:Phage integrase family protein n=1 Tax=Actinomadura syzygii TaxID=1427538 RepID=A0A5D0TVV7_9ACTN|nr:tyrosine-type recombinase/integrase [Actinomadura syzygii]TYC10401.1 phage integrase family protein [Actinomadura syzygii]
MASVLINGYRGSIYREGKGYTGVLDLGVHPNGKRNRPKRKAATKAAVEDKLTKLAESLEKGRIATRDKTVTEVVADYIDDLERQGRAPQTIKGLRSAHRNHIARIGALKVDSELNPTRVSDWLIDIAENLSTKSIINVHGLLSSAIDRAIVHEITDRNVSRMVANIQGKKDGRESKSFSPEQVRAILARASAEVPYRLRFGAYVVLALTSGLRGDELDGLKWYGLDMDAGTVSVVRADRHRGKTKTKQSVRSLELADIAIAALRVWREIQVKEFAAFRGTVSDETFVFTRPDGTQYTQRTARYDFRRVLIAAGISDPDTWAVRETRTTFVSVMSHNGVPREVIADICGHTVRTLERYYRKVLRPVHRQSADVINSVFRAA